MAETVLIAEIGKNKYHLWSLYQYIYMRLATLLFLMKENEILLAMKKRGFGVGKWNGIGGKVLEEETIERAAIREAEEEIGIIANENYLDNVGDIKFYFKKKPEWNFHVHIFVAKEWEGEPKETEEMRPQWYKHHEIPYNKMWVDDKHWLPFVLAGKRIKAECYFDDDGETIGKFEIKEI